MFLILSISNIKLHKNNKKKHILLNSESNLNKSITYSFHTIKLKVVKIINTTI